MNLPAPDLRALAARLSPDELADLVDRLSPAETVAMQQMMPASRREHATAAHPLELARMLDPQIIVRPHLQLLSQRLASAVASGGRLIVNLPPRRGKSTLTSIWGPIWFLDRFPGRHVAVVSYAEELPLGWSRDVRDTIRQHAARLSVRVAHGSSAARGWDTTSGGGMVARGIAGGLTGRGANLLIVDDPYKDMDQAHSRAYREKVWSWWQAVAETRLEPGAAVVVCHTRWHEDDLTGRLLSPETEGDPSEWDVLNIPAIAVHADPDGGILSDPLGRPEGEPLLRPSPLETVATATADLEATRARLGPYIFGALYQGRPSAPVGAIFLRGWWQYWHPNKEGLQPPDRARMRVIQTWDMAFKDTADGSYVVGQVWGAYGPNRYLLDQFRGRVPFTGACAAMRAMAAKHLDTSATYVEDKANGPAVIDQLKQELPGIIPDPVPPGASKESRAWQQQGLVEAGNVWLPSPEVAPWVRGFVDEAADFPRGTSDDQVDAFTMAMRRLAGSSARVHSVRQAGSMPSRLSG